MNRLTRALYSEWQQCCHSLYATHQPTLLEGLGYVYLAEAHAVTQFTLDAERMQYPQFRDRLLCIAAEAQGHVSWLRDTLLALGGAIPTRACTPTVAHNSWATLLMDVAAERRSYEALLEPMHLAEQAAPEMAEGLRRIRATKQQHRAALLDMLVKSDPSTLPRDLAEGSPSEGRPQDRGD
jgi:rubrerythrin